MNKLFSACCLLALTSFSGFAHACGGGGGGGEVPGATPVRNILYFVELNDGSTIACQRQIDKTVPGKLVSKGDGKRSFQPLSDLVKKQQASIKTLKRKVQNARTFKQKKKIKRKLSEARLGLLRLKDLTAEATSACLNKNK